MKKVLVSTSSAERAYLEEEVLVEDHDIAFFRRHFEFEKILGRGGFGVVV
jgi:hypothetical protein